MAWNSALRRTVPLPGQTSQTHALPANIARFADRAAVLVWSFGARGHRHAEADDERTLAHHGRSAIVGGVLETLGSASRTDEPSMSVLVL